MRSIYLNFSCLFFAMAFVSCANSQQPAADIELNWQNVLAWRDFILPTQEELGFMKIPWRRTFKDGIVDAKELDVPVLLWTMNGHPLGCT